MADPTIPRSGDEALLKEIRERFEHASDEWRAVRDEGKLDMQYVAGDPWDTDDKAHRKGRPTVAPNELEQYFNQVINDARANPIAMKFDPSGNGADEKGAEFYRDKAREIEYRSHAQIAYIAAFENALQRGFGWVRVYTQHADPRSFDQDIWIGDIPNPDLVLPDPLAKRPDSSDMRYLFYFEKWPLNEFTRAHPTARVQGFTPDLAKEAPTWISADSIMLAEYWKVETTERNLLLLRDSQGQMSTAFEDELDKLRPQAVVVKQRKPRIVKYPKVRMFLTNGLEVLERSEWAGKHIPFVSCFGKVIYVDRGSGTKREILSMTRFGRAPWKLYCYYRSQQAEMAGMIPKVPVQGVKGQFRGVEDRWQEAMHQPVAYLEYEAMTERTGQQLLPPPTRLDYPAGEHLQALELCAEGARRAIQAAMGTNFLPTAAQRRNEKSGVALDKIDEQSQKGSFHYIDHYKDMIRQVGIIVEDLMDKIHDTARDTAVRKPDESTATVRINDPQDPRSVSTKGDYLVTVSTGPNEDSEREAQAHLAEALLGSPFAPRIIDLVLKLRGSGPIIDEMADRLTPPEFRKPSKDGQPNPADLQQKLAQAMQQIDLLSKELEQRVMQQQTDAVKLKAAHDLQIELQQMKNAAALRIAAINAAAKGVQVDMAQAAELERMALEADLQAFQTGTEHAHDVRMAMLEHQQTLEAGDQAHQQALEQGDQSNAATLEQQNNQAALQPPTDTGEGGEAGA